MPKIDFEKDNLIKRSFCSKIELRDVASDSSEKIISLQIRLDSLSPTYGHSTKWNEKIAKNAFDESLELAEKGEITIYSYADHDMDIKNIIASSKDESTKIFKKDDTIFYEFVVDESDPIAMKTYKLIQNGSLTANSFIFKPTKTTYVDYSEKEKKEKGVDYTVIVEKGELLSVDPVVYAFYTQNTMSTRNAAGDIAEEHKPQKEKGKINMRELLLATIEKAIKTRKLDLDIEAIKKQSDEELMATMTEIQVSGAIEKLEKNLDKKLDEQSRKNLIDNVVEKSASSIEEMKKLMSESKNKEVTELRAELDKVKASVKRDAKEELKKASTLVMRGKYWNGTDTSKTKMDNVTESLNTLRNRTVDAMESLDLSDYEKKSYDSLLKRDAFTGATSDVGAFVIPINETDILVTDMLYAFPELDLVRRRIGIVGEGEISMKLEVPFTGAATPVAIGDPSTAMQTNFVKTKMTPVLYSNHTEYSPLMEAHVPNVETMTRNMFNAHRQAIRKKFAADLFTHKGVTFASLTANNYDYTGGITSDAIVNSATVGALALADFENIILDLQDKYGDAMSELFSWYMHVDIWKAIIAIARATEAVDNKIIVNVEAKTIYGIKVVTNSYLADKTVATGKIPAILLPHESLVMYGGTTEIRDSEQVAFLKRNNTRQVNTRASLMLFDYGIVTRAIKIA